MSERVRKDERCSGKVPPGMRCPEKAKYAYGWGGGGVDLCDNHAALFEAQVDRWLRAEEIPPWRLAP